MKSMQVYLVGYAILLCGFVAGLWKLGVLARLGAAWTAIGIVVAIGLGILVSFSLGETIPAEADQSRPDGQGRTAESAR